MSKFKNSNSYRIGFVAVAVLIVLAWLLLGLAGRLLRIFLENLPLVPKNLRVSCAEFSMVVY